MKMPYSKNKKFPCHNCHKIGHYAKNCTEKSKSKFKQSKKHNSKYNTKTENVLLASLYVNNSKTTDWYIDSGATSHMTNCESVLVNKKPIANREVTVADNTSLKATHNGNIRMSLTVNNKKSLEKRRICTKFMYKFSFSEPND